MAKVLVRGYKKLSPTGKVVDVAKHMRQVADKSLKRVPADDLHFAKFIAESANDNKELARINKEISNRPNFNKIPKSKPYIIFQQTKK